jgi:hypothetical protein
LLTRAQICMTEPLAALRGCSVGASAVLPTNCRPLGRDAESAARDDRADWIGTADGERGANVPSECDSIDVAHKPFQLGVDDRRIEFGEQG